MPNIDEGFDWLFDNYLDLDDEGLQEQYRSGDTVIHDRDINFLRKANRVALAKGPTVDLGDADDAGPGMRCYDVPLVFVAHAHPRCWFKWTRLTIDLSSSERARIRDMSPREVRGSLPIEIKTTVGVGLKFEIVPKVLSGELKSEHSSSRSVYFPEILSSGPKFTRGYWDFLVPPGGRLHANRELRLLVTAPADVKLFAQFNVRADVTTDGGLRVLPLLRKRGQFEERYLLYSPLPH